MKRGAELVWCVKVEAAKAELEATCMELEDAEYDDLSSSQLQGSAVYSIRNGSKGAIVTRFKR